MTTQPTILVKKADGTTARMTLDEVKAMKKHETGSMKHKASPPQQALATTAPVKEIFVDEAKAGSQQSAISNRQAVDVNQLGRQPKADSRKPQMWRKTDTNSPLEEPVQPLLKAESRDPTAVVEDTPLGPAKDVVEKVLKKAGWDLSDATKSRLTPLIVSRVKEVRTEGQFLVHAMTPTHRGGVGLSPAQAEQLLAAIQSFLPKSAPLQHRSPGVQSAPSSTKSVMSDITPPQTPSKQMGPKEEFAAFSLADFKRLGATTDAALSRLKEKFDTLKTESYILFLDVRDAWFQSPLATAYVDKVLMALREKKKMSDVLSPTGSKEDLSLDVINAIAEVNKYISI